MVLIRASIGTLAVLGLLELKMIDKPTTAYLLQYSPDGCRASCIFCLQSRRHKSGSYEKLGRVIWPPIDLELLEKHWNSGVFKRVCFQTVIKPGFVEEALNVLRSIRRFDSNTPISLAITPVPRNILIEASKLGVDSLGVGLDTATPTLFKKWSKPYSWSTYWSFIEKAIEVFGKGNVYVHLIIGLGESLRELVDTMKKVYSIGGRVALFNYTNIRGYSEVDIHYYRLVQVARYLLEHGLNPDDYIDYEKLVIKREPPVLDIVNAFYTSGCPECNRPFYNESPRGPIYNIPSSYMLNQYMYKLKNELAKIGLSL